MSHPRHRVAIGAGVLAGAITLAAPTAGTAVAAPAHGQQPPAAATGAAAMGRDSLMSRGGALAAMRTAKTARAAGTLWLASQRAVLTAALGDSAAGDLGSSATTDLLSVGCDVGGGAGSVSFGSLDQLASGTGRAHQFDQLIPAGDLEGQGRSDVLDFRLGEQGRTVRTAVTARDAKTGAALWSRVGAPGELMLPLPDRVGAARSPGVLLVAESLSGSGSTVTVTLTVRAVSGAGATLWSTQRTGQITDSGDSETLTNLPDLAGVTHDVRGRGDDLLLSVTSGTSDDSTDKGTVQPEILSVTDGSITAVGAPLSSAFGTPTVTAVPDLSGDGLDDMAAAVPGKPGHVVAERGNTGATIWTSPGVPVTDFSEVSPVGAISGGRDTDLVVESDRSSFSGPSERVTLIRGSDGRALWTRGADCVLPVLKAGRHLVGAVGLVTDEWTSTRKTSTATLVYGPRTSSGRLVYRKRYVATGHRTKAANSSSFDIETTLIGDVQPDGARDLGFWLQAGIGKKTVTRRGVISGRDGRLISEPINFPADGSLRRGEGTDLLRPVTSASGIRLMEFDGASGRRLFETPLLRGTHGLGRPIIAGLRVTGHQCSDLSVSASNPRHALVGLFTAPGQPRWTVTMPSTQIRDGHVHRYHPSGPSCL